MGKLVEELFNRGIIQEPKRMTKEEAFIERHKQHIKKLDTDEFRAFIKEKQLKFVDKSELSLSQKLAYGQMEDGDWEELF